jgi:hypothetical protein
VSSELAAMNHLLMTFTEVRFKDHGLTSVEVIDNGSGIAPSDYDSVGLSCFKPFGYMLTMHINYSSETPHFQVILLLGFDYCPYLRVSR